MSVYALILSGLILGIGTCQAESIRVAVASNFSATMKQLIKEYQNGSPHKVLLASGSTGKHYAQILHGAPFDLFFAADSKRPELLDSAGIGLKNTRFTYAYGQLALWSANKTMIKSGSHILQKATFRHLAIANPKLAPYGAAAMDVLEQLKLVKTLQPKLVFGENISQVFHFIASKNAELGFIAFSQLKQANSRIKGSFWLVPASMHRPIEQQAIQLTNNTVASDFIRFVKSPPGQDIINNSGYSLKKNTP